MCVNACTVLYNSNNNYDYECGRHIIYIITEVTVDSVPRINENMFETNILRSYLHDNSISVDDMIKELITKFEAGEYHPPTSKCLSFSNLVIHICI